MNLSNEAKVGAVTLIGFLLLAYMIINLGNFSFGEKGSEVKAVFSQVNGLKEGGSVRYAGVEVGKVETVRALADSVEVILEINPGVKIAEGSKFTIETDGLLGEKYVNIMPPHTISGYLGNDVTVHGEDPQGLDQLVSTADKVLKDVQKLVLSLNEVFGDAKVKESLKATVINAREITEQMRQFSAALNRMGQNNEQDIRTMVINLKEMSGSLREVAGRVDTLVTDVDDNGQTAKDLREAIQNLKNTSTRVEKIAASIEGLATDPETTKNIKETLKNSREASAKANRMLTKFDSLSFHPDFEVLYNSHDEKYRSDANIRINTNSNEFTVIGVNDIGEGNKANFQFGKGDENFSARAGLVSGKAGIGADAKVSSQLRLSLDVYDPNDVRVKLRTQYELAPNTFLVGETDGLNKKPGENTYVGLRRTF